MTDFNESDGRYFDVNFFEYYPDDIGLKSLPHSALFPEAVSHLAIDEGAIEFAQQVRRFQGVNKSLWGIRKEESSGYSLEFYFYYPKKYPGNKLSSVLKMSSPFFEGGHQLAEIEDEDEFYLTSVNLDKGFAVDVNIYRSVVDNDSDIFDFHDKGLRIDRFHPRFSSFSLLNTGEGAKKKNDYWGYFDGNILHKVLVKVRELAVRKFPGESPEMAYDFLKYSYPYSKRAVFDNVLVADKEEAIGLYFLRLDIDDFLAFLSHHGYRDDFFIYMTNNKDNFSHLLFDVGMDFYLSCGEFHVKKTAFWGSL